MSKRLTTDQIRQMAQDMAKGASPLQPKSTEDLALSAGTSVIRLPVASVLPYSDNPRRELNPERESIKESIKARGLDQQLTVVKLPGGGYILAKGGKTRLEVLQELALEDPAQFGQLDFLIRPYSSDADLLAAHLVENLARADMSFWDTANGIMAMKPKLEAETGATLSSRELVARLKAMGVVVSREVLLDYDFAVTELSGLDSFAPQLTRNDVRRVLRLDHSPMRTLWCLHPGHHDAEFDQLYRGFVELYPSQSDHLVVSGLQQFLRAQFARQLNFESLDEFGLMVEGLVINPKASLEELRKPPELDLQSGEPSNDGDNAHDLDGSDGGSINTGALNDEDFNGEGMVSPSEGLLALQQAMASSRGDVGGISGYDGMRVAPADSLTPQRRQDLGRGVALDDAGDGFEPMTAQVDRFARFRWT